MSKRQDGNERKREGTWSSSYCCLAHWLAIFKCEPSLKKSKKKLKFHGPLLLYHWEINFETCENLFHPFFRSCTLFQTTSRELQITSGDVRKYSVIPTKWLLAYDVFLTVSFLVELLISTFWPGKCTHLPRKVWNSWIYTVYWETKEGRNKCSQSIFILWFKVYPSFHLLFRIPYSTCYNLLWISPSSSSLPACFPMSENLSSSFLPHLSLTWWLMIKLRTTIWT